MTCLLLAAAVSMTGCAQKEEAQTAFSPKLDTKENITLKTTGFFGNFEAFDQVTNDFNEYYPNVEFTYEQTGGKTLEPYLQANPDVDILMVSEDVFGMPDNNVMDYCVDLSKEDISLDAIRKDMLSRGYHDGKLLSIPMGQNLYGLIVNTSLLDREGLAVPDTYEEFLQVLEALKEKGYTPIQGPEAKVYAELTYNMMADLVLSDDKLYEDLLAGNESAAEKLEPVCEKLGEILDRGFTDPAVNETYPEDNYDQAILKFFEGDVPFWVCNSEKVSGMKKRESKSEAFQANPFEYEYIFAPMGENGVYAYREPWVGFAVNKDAAHYDYAVEFLRFLATQEEINKIADIKGVPSVAVEDTAPEIYQNVSFPEKTELDCVNEGKITTEMTENWYTCTNRYAEGAFASPKEAAQYFVALCSGQAE